MNSTFLKEPFYKGLSYIFAGIILLFYVLGFIYTIINFIFGIVALVLIYKGFVIAGFDKPIVALYNKLMRKQ